MMTAPRAPEFRGQPLLAPLGWLFGSAVRLRNSAYDRGLLAVRHLPVPVVSVGNLIVGGTGKTPLVAALARRLAARGRRPAVVLRGYGGRNARRPGGPALVVSEGNSGHLLADEDQAGDEALLLATSLPSVPVVVSARRYHGGMQAITTCGADLVILDDGFQHRALHRDLDLVALDATAPLGNGRLLPAGLLREPPLSLRRADALILTRAADDDLYEQASATLGRLAPGIRIFRARHRATGLRLVSAGTPPPSLAELDGMQVAAFAGLARPGALRDTLISLGARVVQFIPLADHHPFRPGEIEGLVDAGLQAGARLVITTAKDAVRMQPGAQHPQLAVLEIEMAMDRMDSLVEQILTLPSPGPPPPGPRGDEGSR